MLKLLLLSALAAAAPPPPAGQQPLQPPTTNACKLRAVRRDLSEGFPDAAAPPGPRLAPTTGTLRAAMAFVDFADAPANDTTASLHASFLPGAADWFAESSYGRLRLEVRADLRRFYRMPKPQAAYGWSRAGAKVGLYVRDALAALAAGGVQDFGPVDVLYLVPTRAAEQITFSPTSMQPVTLPGGARAGAVVTFGQDVHWKWGYKVLNHETGHTMGLPDLYPSDSTGLARGAWAGGFDIMGLINGTSPELLAWHKWKFGWIDDGQVDCVAAAGTTRHVISPIELAGGAKMAAVRLNATSALALEVRSGLGHDRGSCSEGLLPYIVDTLGANSRAPPILVLNTHPGDAGCHLTRGGQLNGAPVDFAKGERTLELPQYGVRVVIERVVDNKYHISLTYRPPKKVEREEEEEEED
jgi:M6 family metalloprotease-like protein